MATPFVVVNLVLMLACGEAYPLTIAMCGLCASEGLPSKDTGRPPL